MLLNFVVNPQALLFGFFPGTLFINAQSFSLLIGRLAGISSLTIDPLLGGSQTNPGARLAIQQRVTRDLLLTYSTDVTSTQNEIIQVEYQITKHWSVSATRDRHGGIAVDARWHTAF